MRECHPMWWERKEKRFTFKKHFVRQRQTKGADVTEQKLESLCKMTQECSRRRRATTQGFKRETRWEWD